MNKPSKGINKVFTKRDFLGGKIEWLLSKNCKRVVERVLIILSFYFYVVLLICILNIFGQWTYCVLQNSKKSSRRNNNLD